MREILSTSRARSIFFGNAWAFLVPFLALLAHSHLYVVKSDVSTQALANSVVHGKRIWDSKACSNCHTLFGEGAYFAPELANVWQRMGGDEDPAATRSMLHAWMRAQPSGVEGRRQMPRFDLGDAELDAVIDFLQWAGRVDTQGWPPNPAG